MVVKRLRPYEEYKNGKYTLTLDERMLQEIKERIKSLPPEALKKYRATGTYDRFVCDDLDVVIIASSEEEAKDLVWLEHHWPFWVDITEID